MHTQSLRITTPPRFRFWPTVYSHGWSDLPPFTIGQEQRTLGMALRLGPRRIVGVTLGETGKAFRVRLQAPFSLSASERQNLIRTVRSILRMDEDFREFYRLARAKRSYRWAADRGAGRMLRSATVFEDVVKMICTTNCSWSLTKSMTSNLVAALGESRKGLTAFPTPEALAGVSEKFVRNEIRAGYRSPFLIEFADRVANGTLDVESWRTERMTPDEAFARLRSVKGVGEYAAGNLMRLLGHYDAMAFDSWVRAEYFAKHRHGRRVSDTTIARHYAEFGKWRGLFFWLDMTKKWLTKKLPF